MKESNHTIDELKQEYEQIPVSPHAKERILAGIAQGKAATAVQSHSTKSGERKKKSHINHASFIFYETPVQLLWQPWPRW